MGHFDGGLASPNDAECPQNVPRGQWRYTDGKKWKKDPAMEVNCVSEIISDDSNFNANEVNGKFKIMSLNWDENYVNPKSLKYKTLANTIEEDIMTMLMEKDELERQAKFNVKVERFKRGSVVVNFKVDYELKNSFLAIPFKLRPENITQTLEKDFQFQNGILFRRFAIAANSFNGSVVKDQCSIRGCSHKCAYDYDIEDYVCTCPRDLVLNEDGRICESEESLFETTTSGIEASIASIEILSTTASIGLRLGVNGQQEIETETLKSEATSGDDGPVKEVVDSVNIGTTEDEDVTSSDYPNRAETTTLISVPLPNFTTVSDISTTQGVTDDQITTIGSDDSTIIGTTTDADTTSTVGLDENSDLTTATEALEDESNETTTTIDESPDDNLPTTQTTSTLSANTIEQESTQNPLENEKSQYDELLNNSLDATTETISTRISRNDKEPSEIATESVQEVLTTSLSSSTNIENDESIPFDAAAATSLDESHQDQTTTGASTEKETTTSVDEDVTDTVGSTDESPVTIQSQSLNEETTTQALNIEDKSFTEAVDLDKDIIQTTTDKPNEVTTTEISIEIGTTEATVSMKVEKEEAEINIPGMN